MITATVGWADWWNEKRRQKVAFSEFEQKKLLTEQVRNIIPGQLLHKAGVIGNELKIMIS
jgi:hypothetical protein